MMVISAQSTVYVKAPVSARIAGVITDITGDVVTVAMARPGDAPSGYASASWETDATTVPATYLARRLIAAGDLAAGQWVMWVKVVHAPETIVQSAGEFMVQ